MFKFKGISSTDMQVIIEEEEHFIARAAQRYETIEIEGRNGAIFNELGYSYVERPIYVQCLNINKIDQILAWLNGEGEFEYKGRKTIARFYSQLDPQRDTCIRIIDTNFIRDPFWNKATEEYQTIKESKIKNANGNPIHLSDSSNMSLSYRLNGGDRQESRDGSNILNLKDWTITEQPRIEIVGNIEENSVQFKTTETTASVGYYLRLKGTLHAGTYYFQRKFETIEDGLDGNNYGNAFIAKADWSKEYCRLFPSDNKKSFIVEEETDVYLTLVIKGSGDTGTEEREIKYYDLMLSTEDKEYQPYGAMPSPNYPSNVETVGSNVNILNIVDIDETENKGIKYSVKNGILKLSGTATAGLQINLGSNVTIKKGTYTHSCDYIQQGLFISFDNLHANVLDESNPQKTFSLTEDTVYSKYFLWINQGTILNAVEIKLKLESGEKATPWSPYGMGSVEIDVGNKNLAKINEDYFEITNNNTIKYLGVNSGAILTRFNLKAGQTVKLGFNLIQKPTASTTFSVYANDVTLNDISFSNYHNFDINQIYEKSYTATEDTEIMVRSWGNANNEIIEFQFWAELNELTDYVPYESQSKTMPIQQEMLEGDYIEDVEHHIWRKVIITGNESWQKSSRSTVNRYYINNFISGLQNMYDVVNKCNYFNCISQVESDADEVGLSNYNGAGFMINFKLDDTDFDTLDKLKTFLQERYAAGTPVIVYYKLATPIDLELTEEQEEAREGLNTYKGVTNLSVDNELATLDVEYTAETTEKITNEGNIYSEPIIRLEKTQTEAVELTINDIRFKYNFNNDEYVEINCEEKTVEYEGLNRNRQIEIGYDFPKLKVGENDIIMHSGDCVIKVLRKDRWL